jgi:plastocyanin
VYVENVRTGQTRGRTVEIRQEGKQFSPRVAVVQTGTTVVFPNYDAVFHNVFSSSPGNAFDLGSYRSGDKARGVTLSKPGVVDVFCNMHQKMSASVLVVPSPLYTKVKADGSFRLDNVPIGARKLVAWSPNARVAQQKVEVTGASATSVTFALEREEAKAHANKLGQPYGSYRD